MAFEADAKTSSEHFDPPLVWISTIRKTRAVYLKSAIVSRQLFIINTFWGHIAAKPNKDNDKNWPKSCGQNVSL